MNQNPKKQNNQNPRGPLRGFGIYIIFALILFGSFFFLQNMFRAEDPDTLSPQTFESANVC
jgi:hypothetical protein